MHQLREQRLSIHVRSPSIRKGRTVMRILNVVAKVVPVVLVVLAASGQAYAETQVTYQMKLDCFNAHKQLMDKPSVRTVERCWQTHRGMMTK